VSKKLNKGSQQPILGWKMYHSLHRRHLHRRQWFWTALRVGMNYQWKAKKALLRQLLLPHHQ
jgi:hypothetical protein